MNIDTKIQNNNIQKILLHYMDFEYETLEDWHKICKKKTQKNTGRCLQLYSLYRQMYSPDVPLITGGTFRGCTDIWGHADIWEVYRCMGVYKHLGVYRHMGAYRHLRVYRCMGAYICMGVYRHMGVYGLGGCMDVHACQHT